MKLPINDPNSNRNAREGENPNLEKDMLIIFMKKKKSSNGNKRRRIKSGILMGIRIILSIGEKEILFL